MVSLKLFVLGMVGGTYAFPQPTAASDMEKRVNCAKVTGALSILKKLGPPATSFCSSFLNIPGVTTSTTTVTPVTTITTSTSTVTTRNPLCGFDKRNVPRGYQGYPFAEPEAAVPVDLDKRLDGLGLLAAFARAKVSEGCSCLGLSPKTTTTTTATAASSTSNVVATITTCQLCILAGGPCSRGPCCSGQCMAVLAGTATCT